MAKPKEGDTRGWNKKTGTGYRWKGGKWVQYKNNKPHGPFKGHGGPTGNVDIVGGLKTQGGRLLRTIAGLPDDEQIKSARETGKKYRENNKNRSKTTNNKNKNRGALGILSPAVWGAMGKTKRNIAAVENPSGKDSSKTTSKSKNRNKLNFGKAVKAGESMKKGDTTKSTPKSTSKSEPKKSTVFTRHYKTGKALGVMTRAQRRKYDAEAHAAGGKSFDERVAATGDKSNKRETNYISSQRKKDKETKRNKNKGSGKDGGFGTGTHGKGLPSNPQLKTQPNKDKVKVAPKDLPPGKVKMKDGSIVDRSSLYEKKKKKNVPPGTRLSKMFDN